MYKYGEKLHFKIVVSEKNYCINMGKNSIKNIFVLNIHLSEVSCEEAVVSVAFLLVEADWSCEVLCFAGGATADVVFLAGFWLPSPVFLPPLLLLVWGLVEEEDEDCWAAFFFFSSNKYSLTLSDISKAIGPKTLKWKIF